MWPLINLACSLSNSKIQRNDKEITITDYDSTGEETKQNTNRATTRKGECVKLEDKEKNLQLSINETHKVTHFTGYNKSIGLTARR